MTKERKLKIGNFEIVCWKDFPCFRLTFAKCGYFDGRPQIKIGVIFWTVIITLPFVNQEWREECDEPEYGIAIHSNSFWLYYGGEGNMHGGTKLIAWHIFRLSPVVFTNMKFWVPLIGLMLRTTKCMRTESDT